MFLRIGAAGLIVQNGPQHQDFGYIQHRHLDGDAAGIQRAYLCAAQQYDVCQLCAGGVLVVGDQDDLCSVGLGGAQDMCIIDSCFMWSIRCTCCSPLPSWRWCSC